MKMRKNKKIIHRLPDAELDVMLVVWSFNTSVRPAEIHERLSGQKDWNLSTLQTMLMRLEERGFVGVERRKRFRYYYPIISKEEYQRTEARNFIEKLYDNSPVKLFASLVDSYGITDNQLDEIEEMLRESCGKE